MTKSAMPQIKQCICIHFVPGAYPEVWILFRGSARFKVWRFDTPIFLDFCMPTGVL